MPPIMLPMMASGAVDLAPRTGDPVEGPAITRRSAGIGHTPACDNHMFSASTIGRNASALALTQTPIVFVSTEASNVCRSFDSCGQNDLLHPEHFLRRRSGDIEIVAARRGDSITTSIRRGFYTMGIELLLSILKPLTLPPYRNEGLRISATEDVTTTRPAFRTEHPGKQRKEGDGAWTKFRRWRRIAASSVTLLTNDLPPACAGG
jgi:hypothetical protein